MVAGEEEVVAMDAKPSCDAVVVITGASRGLGLALGCLLAAQGVPVVLTARSPASIERVASALSEHAKALGVQADASDEAAMGEALKQAATLGPLQGLVNNAGQLEPIGSSLAIDLEAFNNALHTNVTGVLVGMRAALRARSESTPLRIVNISSGAAVHAYAGWAAYCASKAAVTMLTQVLAAEQQERSDTSVVCVAPGIIETAMQRTIRAASPAVFPEQPKFVRLKEQGALLHPVEAALTLDWLVRAAPLSWSGRFVDARGDELLGLVARYRAARTAQLERARRLFEALEAE